MAAKTAANLELNATNKTDKAFRQVNTSLKNTARSLQIVQGPLGPVAGRFTALSSALGSISLTSVAATGGLVGTFFALKKGVETFAETEKQLLQLEAQVTATGAAAGKSTQELEELAQSVARSTLESLSDIRKAEGILLSFRTITEDSFDAALVAATNLSAAGFGSVTDAAKQLGKALEDPITGLSSLRRSGVTFSKDQQDVIKALIETGDRAEAMALILDGIERQVGGAGAAAGDGIAGQFDALAQSVENVWNAVGDWANQQGFLSWLSTAAELAQKLADALADIDSMSLSALSEDYQEQLQVVRNINNQIEKLREDGGSDNRAKSRISRLSGELARELEELRKLEAELQRRSSASFEADEKGRKAQEEIAAEEARARAEENRIALAKSRAKEEKEIAAWHKEQLQLFVQEQKALEGIADRLDPIRAVTSDFLKDWHLINDSTLQAGEKQYYLNRLTEEYKENLEEAKEAMVELTDEQKAANDAADDIARTLGDGLKDALLYAEDFGDVMNSVLTDIADRLAELLIIEPLVQGLSGFIGPALGGAASGKTDLPAGRIQVGEAGPELLTSDMGVRIVGKRGPEIIDVPEGSSIIPLEEAAAQKPLLANEFPQASLELPSTDKKYVASLAVPGLDEEAPEFSNVVPFKAPEADKLSDIYPTTGASASGSTGTPEGMRLIGESGPELQFTPEGSTIVPIDKILRPGATEVTVNVINNGEPAEIEVQDQPTPDGNRMISVILNKVAESVSNNGLVGRSIQQTFGTRQRVITR